MNALEFGRDKRLTRSGEFEAVRTSGNVVKGRLMMLGWTSGEASGAFRAGFVTSKRIGGAVVRNRVRRRMRQIVRTHQHRIAAGQWLVTIAKTHAAHATYRELEDEWLRLAERAS